MVNPGQQFLAMLIVLTIKVNNDLEFYITMHTTVEALHCSGQSDRLEWQSDAMALVLGCLKPFFGIDPSDSRT